jgi:hypothetical protein
MPYTDSEKQKAYMRKYSQDQRDLLKKLKVASNLTQSTKEVK